MGRHKAITGDRRGLKRIPWFGHSNPSKATLIGEPLALRLDPARQMRQPLSGWLKPALARGRGMLSRVIRA